MTITQTVEIPADRRLTIDVPPEIPAGKAVLTFKPVFEAPFIDPIEAIERCSGIAKQLGCTLSSDGFLAMRRKDKELEDRLDALHEEQRHD